MARRVGAEKSANKSNSSPSANDLADWALEGLLTKFGHEADWARLKTHTVDEPPAALCHTCAELVKACKSIGIAIRSEDRPNNQFALYNLYFSRVLLKEMKALSGIARDEPVNADGPSALNEKNDSSLNRITSAMAIMWSTMSNHAAHSQLDAQESDENIASTLTKYFTRENFRMTKRENYGAALFFLIGLAARAEYSFEGEKVLGASPAIFSFVLEAQATLSADNATPVLIDKRVVETLERGRMAQLAHTFLGGLLEVGITDVKRLWKPLFGEKSSAHARLSNRVSAERHYVCYRLTSSERDVEVLKSFLVVQAPGFVEDTQNRRDHFAMKVFTNYDSAPMRSVGAVVELGEEIVGFASRRKDIDEDTSILLNPDQFHGATMLNFKQVWFTKGNGILMGMLMTSNQKSRSMACPVLCIRTDAIHSSQVNLGVINPDQLIADMLTHTRLAVAAPSSDTADHKKLASYVWDALLSRPAENVVYTPQNDDETDRSGGPPIVAPDISPRSLANKFQRLGFSMNDN